MAISLTASFDGRPHLPILLRKRTANGDRQARHEGKGADGHERAKIESFDAELLGCEEQQPGRDMVCACSRGSISTSGRHPGHDGSTLHEASCEARCFMRGQSNKVPIDGVTPFSRGTKFDAAYEKPAIGSKKGKHPEPNVLVAAANDAPTHRFGDGVERFQRSEAASADGIWLTPLKDARCATGFSRTRPRNPQSNSAGMGWYPCKASARAITLTEEETQRRHRPGAGIAVPW